MQNFQLLVDIANFIADPHAIRSVFIEIQPFIAEIFSSIHSAGKPHQNPTADTTRFKSPPESQTRDLHSRVFQGLLFVQEPSSRSGLTSPLVDQCWYLPLMEQSKILSSMLMPTCVHHLTLCETFQKTRPLSNIIVSDPLAILLSFATPLRYKNGMSI